MRDINVMIRSHLFASDKEDYSVILDLLEENIRSFKSSDSEIDMYHR